VFATPEGVRRQTPLQIEPSQVIDAFELDLTTVNNPRRFELDGVQFRARATINPFLAPSSLPTRPPATK
jgi:hypothetical protein